MADSGWDWGLIWTAAGAVGNFAVALFALQSLGASRKALDSTQVQLDLARRQTEVAEEQAKRDREELRRSTEPQVYVFLEDEGLLDQKLLKLFNSGNGFIMPTSATAFYSTLEFGENQHLDHDTFRRIFTMRFEVDPIKTGDLVSIFQLRNPYSIDDLPYKYICLNQSFLHTGSPGEAFTIRILISLREMAIIGRHVEKAGLPPQT